MRTTREQLRNMVEVLNGMLNLRKGESETWFDLDYAYGGIRLTKCYKDKGGVEDISYRLTMKEMSETLDCLQNAVMKFNLEVKDHE